MEVTATQRLTWRYKKLGAFSLKLFLSSPGFYWPELEKKVFQEARRQTDLVPPCCLGYYENSVSNSTFRSVINPGQEDGDCLTFPSSLPHLTA